MASIAPSYDKGRQILGEILPLDTPLTVFLDSSERCNFKCSYCFRSTELSDDWGYARDNGLMTKETFLRAAEQLLEFPVQIRRISLSGHGEPLCNKNLPYMLRHIKELGISAKTEIHTNASLLTKLYISELSESGIDRIVVSLQGLSGEAYRRICGVKIDFEQLYRQIKLLYKSKGRSTKIHIKILDTAFSDENDQNEFYRMFSDYADSIYIEDEVPLFTQRDYGKDWQSEETVCNKYSRSFGKPQYCPQVFYTLFVSPDGKIYPCVQIPPPLDLGNVWDTTLKAAWDNKERTAFLKSHLINTKSENHICKRCYHSINSIKTDQDIIDPFRKQILERIDKGISHEY